MLAAGLYLVLIVVLFSTLCHVLCIVLHWNWLLYHGLHWNRLLCYRLHRWIGLINRILWCLGILRILCISHILRVLCVLGVRNILLVLRRINRVGLVIFLYLLGCRFFV